MCGPLPEVREPRARGGIVGRSATGAVGAGTDEPTEVVAVLASSRIILQPHCNPPSSGYPFTH